MSGIPTMLPFLSPGRHRRKRRGVCLMEYTSILAGERFSDHPRCTDPVLATVARTVNDYSTARGRQRLAVLASDLTSAAPAGDEVGYLLARRCLLTALPYAAGGRRHVMIVGLLGLDRAAGGRARGWRPELLDLDTELALISEPAEIEEAGELLRHGRVSPREYIRRGLPVAIEAAVHTIAREAHDADAILAGLLTDCINDVHRRTTGTQVPSASCAESSDTSASSQRST